MTLRLIPIICWKDKVVIIVSIAIKVEREVLVSMGKEAIEMVREIILENLNEVILQIVEMMKRVFLEKNREV